MSAAVQRRKQDEATDKNHNVNKSSTNDDNEKSDPNENKTIYILFISLVIDLLAFTLILPLFPSLVSFYRVNDSSGLFAYCEGKIEWFRVFVAAPAEFNTVLFGGLLGSVFSMLQFIASPIIGGLSDRFGRRKMMLISTTGISLSYLIWVLSDNFTMFVLARIVGGISKGNISLAASIVTDVSSSKTRGKGMALIGVAFSLGFLVGPMIGAAFSLWSKDKQDNWFVYPALLAFGLSVLDVVYLMIFFKETLPEEKRKYNTNEIVSQSVQNLSPAALLNFSTLTNLNEGEKKSIKKIGLSYLIYLFLYSGMEFTLTFLCHLRFNFNSMQQGKMFLFIGVIMTILQGGVVRRLKPGSESHMAQMGLLVIIPSFMVVGVAQNLTTLYIGLGLYALSTAFVVPCMTTVVSKYGEAHQKGVIMGIFRSLGSLGRALGPIFGSFLYWSLGPECSYAVGGILLLVPYFILKSAN